MSWCETAAVADTLDALHYLGASRRGFAWHDDAGIVVFAKPTSRRLPQDGTWLELVRWCLRETPERNSGSQQWGRVVRALRRDYPLVTTVVSYSDPSVGHTGSLYKACNWTWRPTWHRLRPPPSGNGKWKRGVGQSVKDRWVFSMQRDPRREDLLSIKDASRVVSDRHARGHKALLAENARAGA